ERLERLEPTLFDKRQGSHIPRGEKENKKKFSQERLCLLTPACSWATRQQGPLSCRSVGLYSSNQRTLFFTSSAVWRPKNRRTRRNRSLSGTCAESKIPKCCLPSSWYLWFRSLKCRML